MHTWKLENLQETTKSQIGYIKRLSIFLDQTLAWSVSQRPALKSDWTLQGKL